MSGLAARDSIRKNTKPAAMEAKKRERIAADPQPDPEHGRSRIVLTGDIPNPKSPPPSCPFHPHCPKVLDACPHELPALKDIGKGGQPQWVARHLH